MLYAATALWLMTIVLLAGGVYHLWSALATPRMLNGILLPGTLIAQLGHIVALLITGANPMPPGPPTKPDGSPAPSTSAMPKPRLPVIGPLLIGLLPTAAVGFCIYLLLSKSGSALVAAVPPDRIAQNLPNSLAAFWEQFRGLITVAEATMNSIRQAGGGNTGRLVLFIYLMICLSVRLGPLPGNTLGSIGAIAGVAVIGAVLGSTSSTLTAAITHGWPILAYTVGWLLLLLLISLAVRGTVSAVRLVRGY